jgi:molybdopterin-containing oxidoreductase family membrane subunit
MAELNYSDIDQDGLETLRRPTWPYFAVLTVLGGVIGWFFTCWIYQVHAGMGVAGINSPVGWGVYISNFVFWIGIAHSGTLISAILHLVRSRWRDTVSRSSEAMTVIAIVTAGLFPMIHLGRVWVFYYLIPYPSQRQIWPNFVSPLMGDLAAVFTYFTVSVIFFYVGLIPDLAAGRDWMESRLGPDNWRTRMCRRLAAGWFGAASQWRHYGRGYLFFAALATPLVVSVHSVVSWDFAVGILPGWHSTIFPPYFVAGAIHSGLAMVLALLIPMRSLLHLERIIKPHHFTAIVQTMAVTTGVVAYTYIVEPFMAWYSSSPVEQEFNHWRNTGQIAWMHWLLVPLNVLVPLTFLVPAWGKRLRWLFVGAILVNLGMWLERRDIVTAATMHSFLPNAWGNYIPTWVEWSITAGAAAWFLFWFLCFSKMLPVVPITELKGQLAEHQSEHVHEPLPADRGGRVARAALGVLGIYGDAGRVLESLQKARQAGLSGLEVFSPMKIGAVEARPGGPVRYWTLIGALLGAVGGFSLAAGTAKVNDLIVGGKPVISIEPFLIFTFEGLILFGAIGNLIGIIIHARLGGRRGLPAAYDPRFSRDKFGLFVACADAAAVQRAKALVESTRPEELRVIAPA